MIGETGVAQLSVDDAEALIAIRTVLEQGGVHSRDSTPAGRMTAAVLMFAACEASVSLGCDALGVELADGKSVDTQYSKLLVELRERELIREKDGLPGWRDVNKLRRLRNGAVHQMIAPDGERLRGLTATVEGFVAAAVRLCFGVRLHEVVASSCIEDETVRAHLEDAERALLAEAWGDAVIASKHALDAGEQKWKGITAEAGWLNGLSLEARDLFGTELEQVIDVVRVLPFSVDPGEHVWFRSLNRGLGWGAPQDSGFSEEEARRAVRFVTGWQYRLESFRSTYNSELGPRPRPIPETSRADGRPEPLWAQTAVDRARSEVGVDFWEVTVPVAFDQSTGYNLGDYAQIVGPRLKNLGLHVAFNAVPCEMRFRADVMATERDAIEAQKTAIEEILGGVWGEFEEEMEETKLAVERSNAWRDDLKSQLEDITSSEGGQVFGTGLQDPRRLWLMSEFRGLMLTDLEAVADEPVSWGANDDGEVYSLVIQPGWGVEEIASHARAAVPALERVRAARRKAAAVLSEEGAMVLGQWAGTGVTS